jgi:PAS domain-containing protein
VINLTELGALFEGLRAAVTVANEDHRIVFMNDLAIEHYATRGGEALVGTNLLDCHNAESQAKIRQMCARYRAGDLTPTRYHEDKGNGLGESIVLIPLVVRGQFRGIAELMWDERSELVFET